MSFRTIALGLLAGAILAASAAAPAGADALDQIPSSPIGGAGVDCGSVPQIGVPPDLRFWNYDAAFTSCAEAVGILEAHAAAQERSATIGAWNCGIRGAAQADETGILIRCVGPRGPAHALQVEHPL